MSEGARRALDRKEGAPSYYRPLETIALLPGGRTEHVLTYEAAPARRQAFVPPTAAYLAEVREGYRKRALRDTRMLEAAARGTNTPPMVKHLFVYGTLKTGCLRRPLLESLGIRNTRTTRVPGRLLDLGAYPGAVFSDGGDGVSGEIMELADPAGALRRLDAVEGFQGWGAHSNLFQRVLIEVPTTGGRSVQAWSYQLAPAHQDAPLLADGVWRRR